MRTFLAFKLEKNFNEEEIHESINRVKKHYYETQPINFEVEVSMHIYKNIGAVIIDSKNTPLKWKSVVKNSKNILITNSPPPNWKKFSRSGDIEKAPEELLEKILSNKNLASEFSTPTCLSTINEEKEELDIYTDPFGFSRLYEYRGENGWFWSNRPGALTLMANEKAELSQDAWEFMCYAGWFPDTTSPIEKVTRVEAGIRINVSTKTYSPRTKIDFGALDKIVAPRKYKKFDAKAIAKDMLENLASFSELWTLPLDVDLSGGKDSRLCAASVIASNTENVKFNTIGNLEQEANTAKVLLNKINLSHKHNITITKPSNKTGRIVKTNLKERLKMLHHISDGDITPIQTRKNFNIDNFINEIKSIRIQGAAGEIGKATYYGSDSFYTKLLSKGNSAAYYRLEKAYSSITGIKSNVRERANQFIFSIIQDGKNKGISDLYLLDYFYLMERARRWLPQSIDNRRYSSFFSNEFLIQSFNMSYSEKRNLEIYNEIIHNLVPEWDDVPFYKKKTSDRDERTEKGQRIWQTSDKEEIENILNSPEKWNDIFDEDEVLKIWKSAIEGDFNPNIESLFDRLILKATYQDHLDLLNRQLEKNMKQNHEEIILKYDFNQQGGDLVRIVFYDMDSKKFILIEKINLDKCYTVPLDILENYENIKYKYQEKYQGEWRDISDYRVLNC